MEKEEIIAMRKRMGFSQEAFAEMVGTTLTTVCRWEKGKSKPRIKHLAKLLSISLSQEYVARFQANKGLLFM